MDRPNLFTEDSDYNICLSWLCDSTDGQTYSISDRWAKKMRRPQWMSEREWNDNIEDFFNSPVWEGTIGWKHDYCVDDPQAKLAARRMEDGLNALIARLNNDPYYRHWNEVGVWHMKCEKNGREHFSFRYMGEKSMACRFCADLVISELGDGDGENDGKGSLKNCKAEIAKVFLECLVYKYADCVFVFRKAN